MARRRFKRKLRKLWKDRVSGIKYKPCTHAIMYLDNTLFYPLSRPLDLGWSIMLYTVHILQLNMASNSVLYHPMIYTHLGMVSPTTTFVTY